VGTTTQRRRGVACIASNALVSHVGRLEVARRTVLSRLALCLMVMIIRTHTARSDMERRRAL
jgi:hypothetical protein